MGFEDVFGVNYDKSPIKKDGKITPTGKQNLIWR